MQKLDAKTTKEKLHVNSSNFRNNFSVMCIISSIVNKWQHNVAIDLAIKVTSEDHLIVSWYSGINISHIIPLIRQIDYVIIAMTILNKPGH